MRWYLSLKTKVNIKENQSSLINIILGSSEQKKFNKELVSKIFRDALEKNDKARENKKGKHRKEKKKKEDEKGEAKESEKDNDSSSDEDTKTEASQPVDVEVRF